ncbi:hypothetical protein M408DRAFT_320991 [Serendipita vermifera MAFF 305830]|uniref:Uncharacterized protein n=1 Tax=Serendipita vermifera MAFF 305830 TaxID=933852 RepID=A0A0C2WAG6_SERVB|nr:hypothetical protein M408DRAFT_320991 [Serendipita vermifera MAFF 305830]
MHLFAAVQIIFLSIAAASFANPITGSVGDLSSGPIMNPAGPLDPAPTELVKRGSKSRMRVATGWVAEASSVSAQLYHAPTELVKRGSKSRMRVATGWVAEASSVSAEPAPTDI